MKSQTCFPLLPWMNSPYDAARPEKIVRLYHEGMSIEALSARVFHAKVFKTKTLARAHVERCIYADMMIKKNGAF